MTMDRMVEYLENRGFKVRKTYDRDERVYRFEIRKAYFRMIRNFKYPEMKDADEIDRIQRKFLEDLMLEFDRVFSNEPKKEETVGELFDSLTDKQKTAVYKIIGEAIHEAYRPKIENVMFNPPATIVFWSDGTKTVVKDQGEENGYDPEKGLAMAISKKMLGNERSYYNTFIHWLKRYEKQKAESVAVMTALDNIKQALAKFGKSLEGNSNG